MARIKVQGIIAHADGQVETLPERSYPDELFVDEIPDDDAFFQAFTWSFELYQPLPTDGRNYEVAEAISNRINDLLFNDHELRELLAKGDMKLLGGGLSH